jgi:hypothetical protein
MHLSLQTLLLAHRSAANVVPRSMPQKAHERRPFLTARFSSARKLVMRNEVVISPGHSALRAKVRCHRSPNERQTILSTGITSARPKLSSHTAQRNLRLTLSAVGRARAIYISAKQLGQAERLGRLSAASPIISSADALLAGSRKRPGTEDSCGPTVPP